MVGLLTTTGIITVGYKAGHTGTQTAAVISTGVSSTGVSSTGVSSTGVSSRHTSMLLYRLCLSLPLNQVN